ncbi:hypothetical protein U1Q18_025624 [Sarracenia purpurea var. burkii]
MVSSNPFSILASVNPESDNHISATRSKISEEVNVLPRATRTCMSILDEAMSIRNNFQKLISDESTDKDLAKLLGTESKVLISEIHRFGSEPFSPSRMEALEPRMRLLKGLSPVKVDPEISVPEDPMIYKVGPEGVKTEVSAESGTGWGLNKVKSIGETGDTVSLRGKKGSELGIFEKLESDQDAPIDVDVAVTEITPLLLNLSSDMDFVDPVSSSAGNVGRIAVDVEKGDEPLVSQSPKVTKHVAFGYAHYVLHELPKQDLENKLVSVCLDSRTEDNLVPTQVLSYNSTIVAQPENAVMGFSLGPPSMEVEGKKQLGYRGRNLILPISQIFSLKVVDTKGSCDPQPGAEELPRVLNASEGGQTGQMTGKSWADIVACDNHKFPDVTTGKHAKKKQKLRNFTLGMPWTFKFTTPNQIKQCYNPQAWVVMFSKLQRRDAEISYDESPSRRFRSLRLGHSYQRETGEIDPKRRSIGEKKST